MKGHRLLVILCIMLLLSLILAAIPFTAAAQPPTQGEIDQSVLKGVTWLVAQQNPAEGSWGTQSPVAETAFAVVKLEDRAFELGYAGPFDPSYPYKTNVEKGLDYIFNNASTISISVQPAGNPDTNGNGIGVFWTGWDDMTYSTSTAMMAIAASREPNKLVTTGPLVGETYKQVLQDAVDYLTWGQNDIGAGNYRGGWGYTPNSGQSDNSNSGYAVLGLRYAEAPLYGFQCTIPAFVKTELNFWITYIQCPDGGSDYGYGEPGSWENVIKTGYLLLEMSFFGDNISVPRVQNAIGYIQNHWYDTDLIQGWGWNQPSGPAVAQYQAAYSLMKGFESMGINTITVGGNPVDWYQDLATVIVPQQNGDGSWPPSYAYVQPNGSGGPLVESVISTEWALFTLEKVAPPPEAAVVPATSFWGGLAAALLFCGMLVWVSRRRVMSGGEAR